ncbi:MAG: hypothetical protein AAF570_13040, partial [Bacteroidota bacterium]
MKQFLTLWFLCCTLSLSAQLSDIVTYAGGAGKDGFFDVVQLSDGTFLLSGYSEDLNWVDAQVPRTALSVMGILNGQGNNRYGFLLQLDSTLQTPLQLLHFPQGGVEDIRFIKTTNQPGQKTGALFISGNTLDTKANNGGYFIAKLNNNFVDGVPTDLEWALPIWAEGYIQSDHPWDVGHDGKVVYLRGQTHAFDWSAAYRLDADGNREVVPEWRTHWISGGGEHRGPANQYGGGIDSLDHSGIIFKRGPRCALRSWTQADYDLTQSDGNGGTKKGKWPFDVFFDAPCDPANNPTTNGPGYTGYRTGGNSIYGPSSVAIDRRNNDIYIGLNTKSVLPDGNPDFEPAIVAYDSNGALKWWSRLYHEITPAGDTVNSSPDQYIDALAIDYSQNQSDAVLTVAARCHGNNVENLWEGNVIPANPSANGFQNRFTGTNGNIHISWLGKLKLTDGTLQHSTYVAEYAEGTGGFGAAHPDPLMDGWPDPNGGWPNVNTTRLACNNIKVTANGSVCVLGTGRRTITTANAYQKMVKPGNGGLSSWNEFVRVYAPDLGRPDYSSLVVGAWDTLTQAGGGNTELFGVFKTRDGVIAVGRHEEDGNNPGTSAGNDIPVTNVPAWGAIAPGGESAILVHYTAPEIVNSDDSPVVNDTVTAIATPAQISDVVLFPNPNLGDQFQLT